MTKPINWELKVSDELNEVFEKNMKMCDLNIANIQGITPLFLLVKYKLFTKFEHILKTKKLLWKRLEKNLIVLVVIVVFILVICILLLQWIHIIHIIHLILF